MLDLAAQTAHFLAFDRLRTGPENTLDALHGVSETCRQDCRRYHRAAVVATQLEFEQPATGFEQPATGGIFNADAVNFEGADFGHGGAQLHAHFALAAAGLRLHDGGDRRQANEILVVERGDFARQIRGIGHRRSEVKAYRLAEAQAAAGRGAG